MWAGQTVVIIASGPSLNEQDCSDVERSGLTTVAVNSSWKAARFCHAIYAGDLTWWRHYGTEIDIDVPKYTLSQNAAQVFGLKRHQSKVGNGYNSGLLACEMALDFRAARLILLGFDCSVKAGTHWHGDHTKTPNPNKDRCRKWLGYFERLNTKYPKASIINCSRETEITCFPRQSLEAALCEHGST